MEDAGYKERFDRVLKDKELITVSTWDGEKGWGGRWDRMSPYNRLCTLVAAVIFVIWFLVVFVFGFYKILVG